MASLGSFFLGLTCALLLVQLAVSDDERKTYIIYMGGHHKSFEVTKLLHISMVHDILGSNTVAKPVLHHFKRSINGFVAKLTEEEADRMAEYEGVVSVFPNEKIQLLTTKSWDFIGFSQHVERADYESDVIIGVIDSGIWPESKSFNDKGFGPPPRKWKGTCQTSNVTCNNKIIGAKYYKHNDSMSPKDIKSPRDFDGHGTHTASTSAGNPLERSSMLGLGQGTSRGGVPSARIAVYKACWSDGCDSADLMDAFDEAIADGVDILSASLGGSQPNKFLRDSLSIGSLHAMRNGILTVFAGGNHGPKPSSIVNVAPWSLTVGAGTIDRKFITKVQLGDNTMYEGISLNTFDLMGKLYPIIYAGDAPNTKAGFNGHSSRLCSTNSLDHKLVNGKIVLCEGKPDSSELFEAGVVGVLTSGLYRDVAFSSLLPSSDLEREDADNIYQYIRSTRTPTATIFKTGELRDSLAPRVASFSSRGPNLVTPEILKPDLIAPGVDIIASWSPISPISKSFDDTRQLQFNIMSGTSMACPHVSGAAAYVKSFHPMWSPAAIRSALMTTAKELSPEDDNDSEFAYGAGQVDPSKALTPGLVYDAGESDYITFLCGQGYSPISLLLIFGEDGDCPKENYTARDLNYPSFTLQALPSQLAVSGSFERTVTNVGSPTSTYKAILIAPHGLNIEVKPSVLYFTHIGENQTFVLTIDGEARAIGASKVSASLVWDDGEFRVRSPIIVYNIPITSRAQAGILVRGANFYYLYYIGIIICNLIFLYY